MKPYIECVQELAGFCDSASVKRNLTRIEAWWAKLQLLTPTDSISNLTDTLLDKSL